MCKLRERQQSSGAFSYWPGSSDDNIPAQFATVYALHFLTEVKARGYNIPEDLLKNGISYLKNLSTQETEDLDRARLRAYAIYVLTRNEIVTTNYITDLQLYLQKEYPESWRQDLTAVYLAASYQMLKNNNEAQRLIAGYKLQETPFYPDIYFNSSLGDNAQYLTILAQQFPDRLHRLQGQVLLPLIKEIASNSFDTLSAAYSALALSAYTQAFASPQATSLALNEILKSKQNKEVAATNNIYLSTPFDPDAKQLLFNSTSDNGYFYQITQAGFANIFPKKAVKNGLEVYREFQLPTKKDSDPVPSGAESDGHKFHSLIEKSLQQVPLGTEIEVHIHIRSLNNDSVHNIAIVDLLPGGFEVVRDSIPQDSGYTEIREDRVIFFKSAYKHNSEIVYRIKAVSPGTFTVPPIYATSMYDPTIQANGVADKITVQ